MRISAFPNFYAQLKKLPPSKRKSFIDYTIEQLGYRMNRIPILYDQGKEKWTIIVAKGNKVLFEDSSQTLSFRKAIEYSRQIALEDYEFTLRHHGL
jgi:hypothetical protein